MLYPITKNEEWNYNLNNVRPIALIEVVRKCTVRVLIARLYKILKDNGILQGFNYTGLLGGGTASPIHIINNIVEDTKERGKKLWIAFQDMKKAFDSVSLKMLRLLLDRIKVPPCITSFIIALFVKREIEVITG